MIDPREVQEIVNRTLMNAGDMLVGSVRTYELSMGYMDEERIQHYIKDEISRNMGNALVGKSFIEHTTDKMDKADIYTGRVLVIPYIQMQTVVASITSKIIAELHNGNHLELPEISWV